MTGAIINLAHALDMTVIAEGVENKAKHSRLKKLNGNYIQEFLFYRPMEESDLAEKLRCFAAGRDEVTLGKIVDMTSALENLDDIKELTSLF